MSITCQYHDGTHDTSLQTKACASRHGFQTLKQRAGTTQPAAPTPAPEPAHRPTLPELREQVDWPKSGILHFALPSLKHPERPFLFVAKRGRKPGKVFVNRISAQGATKLDVEERHQLWALATLVEDQAAAEKLYAEVTDHCSRCDKPLTNPVSVARHYGPDCWALIKGRRQAVAS